MSKAAFDARLAALDALKTSESGPEREKALEKALGDRNNYFVAKAARVAGEVGARALIPQLLAAFDRFMTNAAKSDPQCWAKIAIVKALSALGHDDAEVYARGLRHVQMEAVWGGQQDMAGTLRAACTAALVDCRSVTDLDVLEHVTEALVDPDKSVRTEAARAIGRIDRREAGLLLRLRALTGDSEPEPLGAVYAALLAIEGKRGIPFIGRFLDAGGDAAAQEAALALAATHEPAALELLLATWQRTADAAMRTTLAAAVALTRLPEAIEFLIAQAEGGSRAAAEALKAVPLNDAQRARLGNNGQGANVTEPRA
ncbi:MAG TPA: HEAT repeat domain-containing protein [Bryobacteraceae bacterium]|nr:HEAT repeat domain-containing protein [Bryobacteraceae bacterium]